MDLEQQLHSTPGDHGNWPMLKLRYRAAEGDVAAVLPPGFEPGAAPEVTLTVYNVPVNGEPEHGLLTTVRCAHRGREGEFALGYAIDKEAEIFISQEKFGQPKYPAEIKYYRLGDELGARVTHQNYTFLEYYGRVSDVLDPGPDFDEYEFWVKYSRRASYTETGFDFPPHVVNVVSNYGTAQKLKVDGELILRDSPWDPIAARLPRQSEVEAWLWTPVFRGREVALGEPLDAQAYEPWASTIGNSRWRGSHGGPAR
ncbi:acetoacetate decarboxylase family protein [Parahaliea mediterranea]|uniref:Acetoacetate decarboxylase family protein n=1 Tax=Parahaliea mediterranea TaxID=651086 RepID=A0A939DBY6_9GAMM|nr:acetoacetate decarboxylase family protein [Parahaliea mediterranea]MBN7795101.1 acetoacetate decarboxylase family protein [Parahaliea mediterranea]